jgi:hypothetical protein
MLCPVLWKLDLTVRSHESNISSTWHSIEPLISGCESPAGRLIAATGCFGRPGMCGRGCWTRTESATNRAVHLSRTIKRSAGSSPARPPSGSFRSTGRGQYPRGLPTETRTEHGTCDCGSGGVLTCFERCGTRRPAWDLSFGWWTSAARPPPVRPAVGAFPSRRGAGSVVHIVTFRAIGTWWAHRTSPLLAAEARARADPSLVEHRRAGDVPAPPDRRRHLHDRRRRSCLASGRPEAPEVSFWVSLATRGPDSATGEDQAAPANEANVA